MQVPPKEVNDILNCGCNPSGCVCAEKKPNVKTPEVVTQKPKKQPETVKAIQKVASSIDNVQEVLGDMMGDAPACDDCGHITVRNGSCYKCLNCGNSLGCS